VTSWRRRRDYFTNAYARPMVDWNGGAIADFQATIPASAVFGANGATTVPSTPAVTPSTPATTPTPGTVSSPPVFLLEPEEKRLRWWYVDSLHFVVVVG
jgi:hypothetical protein